MRPLLPEPDLSERVHDSVLEAICSGELKAGTRIQAVGWYDNSSKNPHNPDPHASVTWGDQTYEEMMVGFFDIAVPRNTNKWQYFIR